jgi:hypothetical protein
VTARDIEVAVSTHFDYRRNLIVPNIHWGLNLHECDLLILSSAGYATEVEIKISRADLLRDKEKSHGHISDMIKAFWFAVPEALTEYAVDHIPEEAGLLSVFEPKRPGNSEATLHLRPYRCRVVCAPTLRAGSRKFTDAERYQLARLGLMRYWTLRGDHFKADEVPAEVSA